MDWTKPRNMHTTLMYRSTVLKYQNKIELLDDEK